MSIANKIVVGLVGLTVMAVVFSAMLPIMGEVTSAEDTFINRGYYDVVYIETDDVNLSWAYTSPRQVTINDNIIELPDVVNATPRTILCGDNWVLRYVKLNSGYYGVNLVTENSEIGASEAGSSSITITASNGTMSALTTSGSSATASYTYMYCIANDGPMIMKQSDTSAYVNGNSKIYATGGSINVWSGVNIYLKIDGSIENGFNSDIFYYTGDDEITITDVTLNYSIVNGYIDLYNITDFTITVSNGIDTKQITYSYYIVPSEVTSERSVHPDAPTTAILNMLPIIVGAGLLLGAIAFMIVTRK